MKLSTLLLYVACLTGAAVDAVVIGESQDANAHIRYSQFPTAGGDTSEAHDLWKRKGGGRGGGGRSSPPPSSGGGGGGARSPTSPSSNAGGATKFGSGPRPAYGGGRTYAGGSPTPYKSGLPTRTIVPFLLVGAAALAFWPFALAAHGAYFYPYHHPYSYYNATSRRNETREVLCGCREDEVCSCDDENNSTVAELVGDGSYQKMDKSVVNLANVNGTDKIVIDGSLPNGTTAEDPSLSAAAALLYMHAGWWPVVATVAAMVFYV